MGADQYTSSHRFDDLSDGGRIELQRDGADPAAAAAIRRHFADIAGKFADADFDAPGLVHAQDVPGTRVMAAKRSLITYTVEVLPRGRRCGSRVRTPRRSRRFTSSFNSSGWSTGRDSGRSGPNRDHGLGTCVQKHAASRGRPKQCVTK
ncbi:MAG: hypothetical protein Q7J79_10995 [Gemmatimonadales bacterium]|nr:hypothetical protein [Gemmatimonadales bacterium]